MAGLLLCLCFIAESAEQASLVWIRPHHISFKEFISDIKAFGPPHISYAERLLEQARKRAEAFNLKDRLFSAQELYLAGQGQKASALFKEITSLSLSADWEADDRRIILYSFLRQAQSETDPEKRKALLLSAGDFALSDLSSSHYIDQDLFPPPLLRELESIQKQGRALGPRWESIFPDHELIVINGERVSKSQLIQLPEALYRVSAFSSSHQPYKAAIRLSTLLSQKIKTKKLTSGPCARLVTNIKDARILPFNKASCPTAPILKLTKRKIQPQARPKDPSHFIKASLPGSKASPLTEEINKSSLSHSSLLLEEEFLRSDLQKKPSWQKNAPAWLIAGLGAVIISAVIYLSDNTSKPPASKPKRAPPQPKYVY